MNLLKAIAIGASLFMLAACSTTPDATSERETMTSATQEQMEELANKVGDRVFFELDSSALTQDAQETLRRQAAFMMQHPELHFVIEGHCDERYTREYNLALGARRAEAVQEYLINLGVEPRKLSTVSYGKERPAVLESNEWAWSQNRRGVTVPK